MKTVGIAVGLAGPIAVVGFALSIRQQREITTPDGVQTFSGVTAGHSADPVTYSENPPVGGAHDPVWQNCGCYPAPVRNENAVHSLEHGAVWITYQPDLPQDQITTLRNLAGEQSFILISPTAGIPAPSVAAAWGQQLQLESAADERLSEFIRA